MSGPQSAAEPGLIAGRLARKLGCSSVATLGCATEALVAGLDGLALNELDGLDPRTAAKAQDSPFVILSHAAFRDLSEGVLSSILAVAPAALVIGADTTPLTELREVALARGLEVLRSELVGPPGGEPRPRSTPAVLISDRHDPRADALTQAGMLGLHTDPLIDTFARPERTARVCVVSYEVVGPSRNGGIGTANTSLALALARGELDVSLLYTGAPSTPHERDKWAAHFADRGVRYRQLEADAVDRVSNAFVNVRRAWATYEHVRTWHREEPFDVIHGPECQGHLAFVALAKQQGVDFGATDVVTGVHSPTRWCMEANREPLDTLTGLADEHLEQVSVRRSDAVHSPSGYMLSYLRARGWELPARSFVQQYLTSDAIRALREASPIEAGAHAEEDGVELVFFGRLEKRKGLVLFCNALDTLAAEDAGPIASVTFMGSLVSIDGVSSSEYLDRRRERWPWPVRVEADLSQPEAVSRLSSGRCLAVMPSLVDNSPNTVYEALGLGLPIVVSRAGGTAELIAPDDLARCTFDGRSVDDLLDPPSADVSPRRFDPTPLAAALRRAVAVPPRPAARAVEAEANDAAHVGWNSALPRPSADSVVEAATVSRVTAGSAATVDAWNEAATSAKADLLAFCPDHVEFDAELEDTVARGFAGSDADVMVFVVRGPRSDGDPGEELVVPIGGPPALGLSHQIQGSNGCAIRVNTLADIGGFIDEADPLGDLLRRCSLAGLRIETLARPVGRRTTPSETGRLGRTDEWPEGAQWDERGERLLARLRPFQQAPHGLADLPALYRALQELTPAHRAQAESVQQHADEVHAHADRVQTQVDDLKAHADRVQAHADRVQARLDGVQAHADRLAQENARLQGTLRAVCGSSSWRVTAPLRKLAERLRALRA